MFLQNLRFPGTLGGLPATVSPPAPAAGGTKSFFILVAVLCMLSSGMAHASDETVEQKPRWLPQLLGAQATLIYQNASSFHSPYEGEKSFVFDHTFKQQMTQTYGVYLGSQVTKSLQLYADFEMFRGSGISAGLGLGGYSNGDVIRAGPANLGPDPYLARLYARYVIPLSQEMSEPLPRATGQMPVAQPVDRIEIKAGKLAPTDDFDQNRYANNQRTQFLNYAFIFNTAWDYSSDTRGYSIGASIAIVHPTWRLIFGSYQVPTDRNGIILDSEIYRARGDNAELSLAPWKEGLVIRLLAYRNQGRMGDYRDAMALGALTSTVPNTVDVEKPGHVKYGLGINIEQPLANDGETGLFARVGWENGTNSPWSYTESDRHASLGLQVSGRNWGRSEDRAGVGVAVNGITASHQHYLGSPVV